MFTCTRVATGQEMVLEKFFKVTEFYLESGKIDILKKSQGKLKQFNGNTADLILLKTGTNMWVHCDLNEFITLNPLMPNSDF